MISNKIKEDTKICNSDVVRTKQLKLLDSHNQIRMLAKVIDGETQFVMCDADGNRRVEIKTGEDGGAEIGFIADNHTSRIGIALRKNGNALITLLDAESRQRFKIEVDEHGTVETIRHTA